MCITVDAKGFSCPQPVLMTLKEMKKADKGEIVVLVDTVTSRENVSRAAMAKGWTVKNVEADGTGFRISIIKE